MIVTNMGQSRAAQTGNEAERMIAPCSSAAREASGMANDYGTGDAESFQGHIEVMARLLELVSQPGQLDHLSRFP